MPGTDGAVVVTGGASGMGEATARMLVSRGIPVLIADIQVDKGEELASELGDAARFRRTDVTVEEDVAALVDDAAAIWGGLAGMVNNAGIIGAVGPLDQITVEEWDFTVTMLLRSVFLGTKHAIRVMKPRCRGSIVNTSSIAAFRGGIGPHAYAAAKAGVVSLTRNAAAEVGAFGIRVNSVAPGRTATPMVADTWAGDHEDLAAAESAILGESPIVDRVGRPRDIAEAIVWLLSDAAGYVSGQVIAVDGGMIGGSPPARTALANNYAAKGELIREAGRRGLPATTA